MGNCNTKYLLFDTKEQRNNFVLMYKDLFTPYSTTGGFRYEVNKDECTRKQLLEGYQLDPKDLMHFVDSNKYGLAIKIDIDNFATIRRNLLLNKHKFYGLTSQAKSYWTL